MRVDSANRSFLTLLALAVAPFAVVMAVGCGVASVAGYRLLGPGSIRDASDPFMWAAVAFVGATFIGAVAAVRSLRRQRHATRMLRLSVEASLVGSEPRVLAAAQRANVAVDVIDDDAPYSFTWGLRTPRVAVSRGLVDAVDDRELDAVLAHEAYHVGSLDPLKMVIARTVPAAFFYLPALPHLLRRYLAGRELAADRRAVSTCGSLALASVLYKVVSQPPVAESGAAAAIGGVEVLGARIDQLTQGREPPFERIPWLATAATAGALVVMSIGVAEVLGLFMAGMDSGRMAPGVDPVRVVTGVVCGALWFGAVLIWRRIATSATNY